MPCWWPLPITHQMYHERVAGIVLMSDHPKVYRPADLAPGTVIRHRDEIDVLVDAIDLENEEAVARSPWDAPEIDGNVFLPGETSLKPGDMVRVRIVEAEEYDLIGEQI